MSTPSARPPYGEIGARIRIKSAYADVMATHFADAGFAPLHVEFREDGDVSFWFDKSTPEVPAFINLVRAIPFDYWVVHAIVGSPVFNSRPT